MPIATNPEWQQLALYAAGGALLLILIFNIPYVGRVVRSLFSFALLALCLFLLLQQAPFDPNLSRLTSWLGLHGQQVNGETVRISMARDGHFWANVSINGTERRMLIDSGATVTALSQETADLAGVDYGEGLLPVMMRTAAGTVQAQTGTVETLGIGGIEARDLKVVISPALGTMDVLGMNFLSQLASWRVEGQTLILEPEEGTVPAAEGDAEG
ncbi:retropepsin-like aspartic protease family protein [Pacificimonas flava]|uniref:Peptidase A2 domain-containing protein n=1 Tax=Pacificimonas flava TaxID=1234595 RepID=M2TD74_9SPHN|nr:retropepsin-like aspartic protease [Pacificimonas flava]EMD84459.1 hypothetical protein C725_0389 [Pacificimonas flava]MBB5279670.1 aspartyl protease family protein [Pacificimonas flava]